MLEPQEIFVRFYMAVSRSKPPSAPSSAKWPDEVLILDTETRTDTAQRLTFGAYRRAQLGRAGYQTVEEDLFYDDSLIARELEVLRRYCDDPRNLPQLDVKRFPPPMRLHLYSRSDFVERVFWKSMKRGAMIVGFNLPFDISRLAVRSTAADDGGWSFVLSLRKSKKTGEIEVNPERPRVVVTAKDSKTAFIQLRDIYRPEEWPVPREGRFLDLRTLGWALRNESFDLKGGCKAFGLLKSEGKMDYKPTGKVTFEEIKYCRGDVRATKNLLNAMKAEFDRHPLNVLPEKAYSPASLAKGYLEAMKITRPKDKFQVPDKHLGIAMQSYYGGRAEVRIRKTHVPVVLLDFTSQYPTVNALLGYFDVLTADSVSFEDCTEEVREMLATVKLEDTFEHEFWKKLPFFALVMPEDDLFPVRAMYNGRTRNIGLNHLTSEQPVWFAGPDVIRAALKKGRSPHILEAIRMVPSRTKQPGLVSTNLAGMVAIDPVKDDFFRQVVEQKSLHKQRKNKALADFLKVLSTSGSYGLYVQVDQGKVRQPQQVKLWSGETMRERSYSTIEKSGDWYFPPVASLITAGGRLLLAMLEECVADEGGSYLFCDTDSLCIVSSEQGGLVPCKGGSHKIEDGREAIKALSWSDADEIVGRFNNPDSLNPYNPNLVHNILKIEDINFIDSDPNKPRRQLFGYAVSAKRYALYTRTGDDLKVVKASGHGLGYLYPPKKGFDKTADALLWVLQAWSWLLRKDLGLPCKGPCWFGYPALMRIALTSPNVMRTNRPDWLSPFGFFFMPLISDLDGYPAGCCRANFKFILPFDSDPRTWRKLVGRDLGSGRDYRIEMVPRGRQDKVVPDSLRIVLRHYLDRPESKSLAPDGTLCVAETEGLLRRASVVAKEIVLIGKEADRRWEQGDDMSLVDFVVPEDRAMGKMVIADPAVRSQIASHGMRRLIRVGFTQHTLEAIRAGKPVRRTTLQRAVQFLSQERP